MSDPADNHEVTLADVTVMRQDSHTSVHPVPYLAGLDGLRAIAVLPVMAYHALQPAWPGGFLGVEVFFVISGYLITSILLAEYASSGRVALRAFWMRRARRLLPALYLVLAVVVGAAVLFVAESRTGLRADVLAALSYSTNWYQITREVSYFQFIGRPPLLNHLWSLAVEEQFYLVWPILLPFLLRRLGRVRSLAVIAVGAIVSAWWMAALYTPGMADPSKVYLRTDTRAAGLLVGAALAFVWTPWKSRTSRLPAPVLDATGVVALIALCWFYTRVNDFDPFIYQGGFLLLSVVTAVAIAVAVHPAARIGRLLAIGPMRYVGQRSYGLYLWHWPVFQVTRPYSDVPFDGNTNLAFRLAVTFACAELSYRYVERPIRAGTIRRHLAALRATTGRQRQLIRNRVVVVSAAVASLVTMLGVGLAVADPVRDDPQSVSSETSPVVETASTHVAAALSIGDSVMDRSRGPLEEVLPELLVDARGNRVWADATVIVNRYARNGQLPEIVLIHLGTNGAFTSSQFEATMHALCGVDHVLVFTAKVPRSYEPIVNERITDGAARHENVTIIDWHSIGSAHPDWFTRDQVHLVPAGQLEYATMIRQAIDSAAGVEWPNRRQPATCTR